MYWNGIFDADWGLTFFCHYLCLSMQRRISLYCYLFINITYSFNCYSFIGFSNFISILHKFIALSLFVLYQKRNKTHQILIKQQNNLKIWILFLELNKNIFSEFQIFQKQIFYIKSPLIYNSSYKVHNIPYMQSTYPYIVNNNSNNWFFVESHCIDILLVVHIHHTSNGYVLEPKDLVECMSSDLDCMSNDRMTIY